MNTLSQYLILTGNNLSRGSIIKRQNSQRLVDYSLITPVVKSKKVVAIGLDKVLLVFCAVARNASSAAGGIDASSVVVLTRDGRTLSSFIFSTMLGENGGSIDVAQEQDTASMRHERPMRISILVGRMYELPDRSHPSPGCCGDLLREAGSLYGRKQVLPGKPHHAASMDSQGPNTHIDIIQFAGRNTRRRR